MNNTEALKQLLKQPLEDTKQFKDFQERTYQFLLGIYDWGKLIGFKEGEKDWEQKAYDAGWRDPDGN